MVIYVTEAARPEISMARKQHGQKAARPESSTARKQQENQKPWNRHVLIAFMQKKELEMIKI
jgi:hypothetical protein